MQFNFIYKIRLTIELFRKKKQDIDDYPVSISINFRNIEAYVFRLYELHIAEISINEIEAYSSKKYHQCRLN